MNWSRQLLFWFGAVWGFSDIFCIADKKLHLGRARSSFLPFFTILPTSSIKVAAMLNGHVDRGASEISVLSGSGLLWRASVYVLVKHASSSARLVVRVPDFGGSSKDLWYRYGSEKFLSSLVCLLSGLFCFAKNVDSPLYFFPQDRRPTLSTSTNIFHWLRRAFFSTFSAQVAILWALWDACFHQSQTSPGRKHRWSQRRSSWCLLFSSLSWSVNERNPNSGLRFHPALCVGSCVTGWCLSRQSLFSGGSLVLYLTCILSHKYIYILIIWTISLNL